MIKLRHNDIVTFSFMSRYNGTLQASYRVRSAISEALEIGGDPGRVSDRIVIERTQAQTGVAVQPGDTLLIEGKYFHLSMDGDAAQIVPAVPAQRPAAVVDKPA